MKKITFFLIMLLSITAFSQVEIVENFDSTPSYELPLGWTASLNEFSSPAYSAVSYSQCGGTGNSVATGANSDFGTPPWAFEYMLTTPNYPSITNDTDLTVSFSINVFEEGYPWSFPIFQGAPVSDWGSVTLEYSVDGGSNWITAVTVNPSDLTFVDTNTCTTISANNLGSLSAGNDFQARFVTNLNNIDPNNYSLSVILDNVSITQVATTFPNCDATLINPLDGSTGADLDVTLNWQAASGIPTGYTLSVGSVSGGTDIVNEDETADTSYSLNGLGLAYNTEYFVNIVPFNDFGDATVGCNEQTFTTRLAPLPGATCSSPITITSFPYIGAGDDTSNYENNINVGPCGGYSGAYMQGYDKFYEITPTTDISININLANVSEYGAAIHVMEGCPDTSSNCVALLGDDYNTSPPYNLELNNVVLFAGNTYFIVLSSGGFDSSFSFDVLLVTQNSCINPEFTLATVADCGTGTFTVDVDVTYLGDAAELTLTDNVGGSINNISSTGIVNMGPYTNGQTVEFTLTTNTSGETCSYTASTFYYCPPANNDCSGSIALSVNTDSNCTSVYSGTNAGATENAANPIYCEAGYSNTNDVWYSFVATNETIILEYSNIVEAIGVADDYNQTQSTELLSGDCGTFISLACYRSNYVVFNNLTINNTYYIRNSSRSGAGGLLAQTYDICLKLPPPPPANDECSGATELTLSTDNTCNNQISGTTFGATTSANNSCNDEYSENWGDVWYVFTAPNDGLFQFTFSRLGFDPSANWMIYSGICGSLVAESSNCNGNEYNPQVHEMESGESFYIMVRTAQTAPSLEFDLCVFQLPDAVPNNNCSNPTILLESADANGNNAISGNMSNSYPSPEGCASTSPTIWYSFTPTYTGLYHFNLTPTDYSVYYNVYNTDDCSQTSDNFVINDYCYRGPGALDTELVAGNTYLISVFAFNSDTNPFTLLVYPDASLSVESNSFETFKYYPNPVINTFTVEAKNMISSISIYNIIGQQVQLVSPNSLKATINMDHLKNGVYFVTVTINGSQKTIKVIKK